MSGGQELYLSHNYMDLKHSFPWTHMLVALGMHSRWGRDAYLKSYWNWLDGIVVMVSIINMVPLGGDGWDRWVGESQPGITSFWLITFWDQLVELGAWTLNMKQICGFIGTLTLVRIRNETLYLWLTPFPQIFSNPGNVFFPTHFGAHVGALQLEGRD